VWPIEDTDADLVAGRDLQNVPQVIGARVRKADTITWTSIASFIDLAAIEKNEIQEFGLLAFIM
jgi:hypothetical protein